MFVRVALVLLVGLGLLGLVGAFLLSQQQPSQTAAAPPASVRILVAAREIHAGSLIVPGDIETASVQEDKVPHNAMPDDPGRRKLLSGAMLRLSLAAGDAFIPGEFISPGDRGFLASVLEPGMRAVTVGVDAVSGTAGLIWPGDRVDLLLTQTLDDQSLPNDHRVAGETLLENARVIAVDQQLVQGAQAGSNTAGNSGNRTVTLEVTPVDAEKVQVASRLGHLSMAVHSANKVAGVNGQPAPPEVSPQPVFSGDVSAAIRSRGDSKTVSVKVFHGVGDPVDVKFDSKP
jgi:pilus assembly protein CpaB